MKYYNDKNKEVTKEINEKRTELFVKSSPTSRFEAQKRAKQKKSYMYDVYGVEKDKVTHVGFGIPK